MTKKDFDTLLLRHTARLAASFKPSVHEVIYECFNQGVVMLPYETLRSPFKQALYWKQGRTEEEIQTKIRELISEDAPYLASLLERAPHVTGKNIITNAIPGLSWHQWGEAIDCVWIVDNTRTWDLQLKVNGINGYDLYATTAQKNGLTAGRYWQPNIDAVHIQQRAAANPIDLFSIAEIDRYMEKQFGKKGDGID